MKKPFILTFLTLFILCSCHREPAKFKLIEQAHWLVGQWQNKSDKGVLTELWQKLNDSTMVGKSYFMVDKDTLSLENIRLEQRMNKLAYIPTVTNQNNGQAIYFIMTQSTDSMLVFENPEHDFPQKISYSLKANDSLLAEVSAVIEGKVKSQLFRMGKVY